MATVTIQSLYDEARHALETGAIDRAVGISQHLLAHVPHFIEAYRLLGEAYLSQQRLDEAVKAFKQVLQADPESIPAHVGLGIVYERQGNLEGAIAEFEQAMEIKPDLPELRNQLLRLYAEAQGTEGAQLRLSKAGLARLYAKGHMLAHAIQEFEDVLASQPDRRDVQVALAEALWRNGQEDEAATLCRTILNEDPEVLKARLILGYILLASGEPEGEQLWRRAQEQDPYLGMARMLFDILPPVQGMATTVPEWNEAAWREEQARREKEAQQQHQREEQTRREQEHRQAAAAQPVQTPQPATAQAPAFSDEDFFSGSWLQGLDEEPVAPPAHATPAPAPVSSPGDDDLLAQLLAGTETLERSRPAQPRSEPATGLVSEVKPFSLDELDSDDDSWLSPPTEPREDALPQQNQPHVQDAPLFETRPVKPAEPEPFSLEEFALDLEAPELSLGQGEKEQGEDLGLGEFAGLQPFSFDELEEEPQPPSLPGGLRHQAPTGPPANLQPFSLGDLDLGGQEQKPVAPDEDLLGLPPHLQPFSLDELAFENLDAEPGTPIREIPIYDEPAGEPEGFSWQDTPSSTRQGFVSAQPREEDEDGPSIFSKLLQRRQEVQLSPVEESPSETPVPDEDVPEIFSLDDVDLRSAVEEAEDLASPAGESTESTPVAEEQPEAEEPELQPFSLAELGLSDEEIAALQGGEQEAPVAEEQAEAEEPELQPFSLAELGLSDEEIAALQGGEQLPSGEQEAPVAEEQAEAEEPELQPFSLAELGLSDEEIAALQGGEQQPDIVELPVADQQLTPFEELFELGRRQGYVDVSNIISYFEDPEAQAEQIEDLGMQLHRMGIEIRDGDEVIDMEASFDEAVSTEEPELQPFSLAELGLSDEEIAALQGGEQEAPVAEEQAEAEEPELQPFSLAELGLSDEEIAALQGGEQEAPDSQPEAEEPELQPFSLAELGLSDEEIAALQGGEQEAPVAEEQAEAEEPELQPFSLAELGLSDEEIATFNEQQALEDQQPTAQELALSEEEIAALDFDLELPTQQTDQQAEGQDTEAASAHEPVIAESQPSKPEPVVEQRAPEQQPSAQRQVEQPTGQETEDQPDLMQFQAQVEADPNNHPLRLALARMSERLGQFDLALDHYKYLIKAGTLLDPIVEDLIEMIDSTDDPARLHRLHRLLGDAYMKQSRWREAMDEYSWVLTKPRS
ncbi:MAG: hypothetical protein KatS3mg057_1974 [Herpetosiphonaceae bacterium]|nr:MAG: hypothetical protein KatS3mg057_1974 [Herpetosiphonaceae bacterium]